MLLIFVVPLFYEPNNTFGYGGRGKRMKSKLCTYFSAEDPNAFSNTKTIHCRSFETWSEFDALSSIQLQGHRAILLGFKMAPSLHQVNVNGQTFVFISIVHWKWTQTSISSITVWIKSDLALISASYSEILESEAWFLLIKPSFSDFKPSTSEFKPSFSDFKFETSS